MADYEKMYAVLCGAVDDIMAHFKLGQIYAKSSAPGSKEKAFAHYKTAAAYGYTDAMYMMGHCYENGIGIKRN